MSDRVTVARAARKAHAKGYVSDVIWPFGLGGETLFLKEVWRRNRWSGAEFIARWRDGSVRPRIQPAQLDQVMIAQGRAGH
jgi:hypothetical protein